MTGMNDPNLMQRLQNASRAYRTGDRLGALKLTTQLERDYPGDPRVLELHAAALAATAHFDRACDAYERTLAVLTEAGDEHGRARVLTQYARIDLSLSRESSAIGRLDEALAITPDDPQPIGMKVEALLFLGKTDEAATMLADADSRGIAALGIDLARAKLAEKTGEYGPAVERLRSHADTPGLSANQLSVVLSRLGDLLDKAGDYDDAFTSYQRAAKLAAQRHDPDEVSRIVDGLIKNWTPANMANVKRSSITTEQPVFIVGMPRSGTSLAEQILACHPGVIGGGELQDLGWAIQKHLRGSARPEFVYIERPSALKKKQLDDAAAMYVRALEGLEPDAASAARITDKQPSNAFAAGVIPLMFPNAKIVWCQRDPRDIGLSCYFQRLPMTHTYQHDLEHLGRYCRDVNRMMRHWVAALAHPKVGADVFELRYEDLVSDQEAVTRRLLEFVGIPWDDVCLRFHESDRVTRTLSNQQVRQPLYRSSAGRHTHYAQHLKALKSALGDLADYGYAE